MEVCGNRTLSSESKCALPFFLKLFKKKGFIKNSIIIGVNYVQLGEVW